MSVGILILSHERIGHSLMAIATKTLGFCPLEVELIAVQQDEDPEAVLSRAVKAAAGLDRGEGVLILTDIYGATPSNIASKLLTSATRRLVTGLNLPMLIKIFNYAQEDLETLCAKAVDGARDGVMAVQSEAN